ncbi:MAG: hypothetical protein IPJ52_17180 [Rhodocyclaceae bacterium]|nr:hypothetical protein [Rhodocyclaceae bacterium]
MGTLRHFLMPAIVALLSATVSAANVDLADKPLANGISNSVKPNIMFVLDDSGSMGWDYLPDSVNGKQGDNCFKNHLYNKVYFNPGYTYPVPVDASGNPLGNATFGAAKRNGFDGGSSTTNLATAFKAHSGDTAQAAYYYEYTGGGTPTPGTCYANNKYTKRVVTAAQEQNFANWYSYYRTRMQMMKSALSLAFKPIDDTKRVGYMSINNNTGTDFRNLALFDAAGKSAWYNKIFAAQPSDGTGLRWALTTAGRLYGGKLNGQNFWGTPVVDPVQYSCQQNFTILATDGYWNTETTGLGCNRHEGCKLDGAVLGNQDGGAAKPMWDGSSTTVTLVDTYQQFVYSVTNSGCSGANRRVRQQQQRKTITTTTINGSPGAPVDSGWSNFGAATTFIACQNPAPTAPPNTTPVLLSSNTNTNSSGGSTGSLADVAMYYYETDIRDGGLGNCTGALGLDVCENNVPGTIRDTAAHQHMTTFTLGLGINGQLTYAENYEACGNSCDYPAIVQGTKTWPVPSSNDPTTVDDLWHAAVNGRGVYYSAGTPESLASGLAKALAGVNARKGAGGAAATSTLAPVEGDQYAYVALYTTAEWVGDLQRRSISLTTGVVDETPTWKAQEKLDGQTTLNGDSRTIYMRKGSSLDAFNVGNLASYITAKNFDAGPANPAGALSQYADYDAARQAQATGNTGAANMIGFLRGQRGFEDIAGNAVDKRIYRSRTHVLGDIVNSSPVYVNKPAFDYTEHNYPKWDPNRSPTVYAAANDGMLHAFDAATGLERWAFVPTVVIPSLYKLADANYANQHRFFVDGPLTVGDAYFDGKWHSILIGGLGKGGRSYYALDVTNDTPELLWEFSVSDDIDLGQSYGAAQITKREKDGKWVAMFASGYNNVSPGSGLGRLFVVDLETGGKLSEIVAPGDASPEKSGIAWVNGWTNAGMDDNTVQHVYAGDLSGNIWRFDINADTVSLLASVGSGGGTTQPVTSRVELGDILDSSGGQANQRAIYVGTGRYLGDGTYLADPQDSDILNTDTQSFYAIRDDADDLKSWGNFRAQAGVKKFTVSGSGNSRTVDYDAVLASGPGWYLDFDVQSGERVVINPRLFNGDQKTLTVVTSIPSSSNMCEIGGTSYVYMLETQPSKAHTSLPNAISYIGSAMGVGAAGVSLPGGKLAVIVNLSDGTTVTVSPPTSQGTKIKRGLWRELVN